MKPVPTKAVEPTKLRLATAALAGCSGCHMALLDLHLELLELAAHTELVASAMLCDAKSYPENVDLCLVEGAVASEEHRLFAKRIRHCTARVVALGDCAIHTNITGLRHRGLSQLSPRQVRSEAPADSDPPLPQLLKVVLPLEAVIAVDAFLPGCPPRAGAIASLLRRWWQQQPLIEAKARPQRFG
jgi:NAD-reducing hydrogenase small subunit